MGFWILNNDACFQQSSRERDCRPDWQHIRVWDVFSPVTGDWDKRSTTLCSPVSQDLGMEGTAKPRETVLIKGTWMHLEPLNHISLFPSQLWNWRRSKRQTNGTLLLIKLVRNCALGVQSPRTVWNSSYSHSQPCHSRGSGYLQAGSKPECTSCGQAEVGEWKLSMLRTCSQLPQHAGHTPSQEKGWMLRSGMGPQSAGGLTVNSESSWEYQTKEKKLFIEHSNGDGK